VCWNTLCWFTAEVKSYFDDNTDYDSEEEEVEVMDNDMGDVAKENLRRKHVHLCNHNVFIL
jgi:hypothetical protein